MLIAIYIISHLDTPIYVGQTKHQIEKRLRDHLYTANKRIKNGKFQAKLRKYNDNEFSISLIEYVNENHADEAEIYWIAAYNTVENGCNVSTGGRCGNRGLKHSQTFRERCSRVAKTNWLVKSYNGSEQQRISLSKSLKGRSITWGDSISIAKSKGPYLLIIDGIQNTFTYGLNKIAKILSVNARSLKISLKENRSVFTAGKRITVRCINN